MVLVRAMVAGLVWFGPARSRSVFVAVLGLATLTKLSGHSRKTDRSQLPVIDIPPRNDAYSAVADMSNSEAVKLVAEALHASLGTHSRPYPTRQICHKADLHIQEAERALAASPELAATIERGLNNKAVHECAACGAIHSTTDRTLDAAITVLEATLPEGYWWRAGRWGDGTCEAVSSRYTDDPEYRAEGDTPLAAVRALIEKLPK